MKIRNIKLISAMLIILCFLLTGGMFAYWANSVQGDEDSLTTSITIGAGEDVTTTINMSEIQKTLGQLVPAGFEDTGKVSEIVVTYNVSLVPDTEGADGAEATLTVTHGALPSALINVDVATSASTIIVGGASVTVTVSVTLTEPANETEYNEIASLTFDLPLTFSATII